MVPFIEGTFTFDDSYTKPTSPRSSMPPSRSTSRPACSVLRGARVQGEIQPEGDEAKLNLRVIGTGGEELKAQ